MARKSGVTRRQLIKAASAGLAAASLPGTNLLRASQAPARTGAGGRGGPNILFVFTDQERHFDRWPQGLDLPGHERLTRTGTRFLQHHIGATMCTSSRSIMLMSGRSSMTRRQASPIGATMNFRLSARSSASAVIMSWNSCRL